MIHISFPKIGMVLLVALLAAGCDGRFNARPRPAASALWLSAGAPAPEAGTLARLQALGVSELFVEVGHLEPDREQPLVHLPIPELPAATAITLVVTGTWDGSGVRDRLVPMLASDVRQLRFEAEARGLVPVGVHLDLTGIRDLGTYAAFLGELRKLGDRSLFLSSSLPRSWMSRPGIEKVVEATDAVVAFLYGQRPTEREDPAAWDFAHLERDLERLEQMGGRYFLGLTTLGVAYRQGGRNSASRQSTSEAMLRDFLWDPRFTLKPGFSLEGINRMVYSVESERPFEVAGWQLAAGETVRLVRPATAHLEELVRLSGAWQLPHLLGTVYYRVPRPRERLSLTPDNIIAALEPTPATPVLTLETQIQRATGRGYLFRFAVVNRSAEMTELSVLDNNILQIETDRGTIGRVQTGDFERFGFFDRQADGSLAPTFRQSRIIQLHLPILEGAQTAHSGDIEILARGEPTLRLEAWFILPDGRTLRLEPQRWHHGHLGAAGGR